MSDAIAEQLRRTEEALEEALAERTALWEEANLRRAAEQELAEVRKRLDQIEGSPSYRLTEPLRRAKRVAGRLRRR